MRTTLCALGVAVPVLYYGSQALAAPFFPGFSFTGTTASELGSDLSKQPWIFNAGAIIQGLVTVAAAVGFLLAIRQVHPILAWPTALCVAGGGLASLWAGCYPLPDPRHGGHPAFLVALLSTSPLLALCLWKQGSTALRVYLVATLALLAVMFLIMTGLEINGYRGLFQRVFALAVFVPIGVAGFELARRVNGREAAPPEIA